MKRIIPVTILLLFSTVTYGQIQITSSDMPVSGDTLRYSIDLTSGTTLDLSPKTNHAWDFSSLIPASQRVDTYKAALAINPIFITLPLSSCGYKTADSIPGSPIPVTNIYNVFSKKNGPSRYVIEGYSATIASAPIANFYNDEDELYFFPLDISNPEDSNSFAINLNIPGLGTLKRKGYRKTKADGWGTIVTPYYTSAVNCLRVRSEIHEIDTITLTTPPISFPMQINTVEYKWLVSGEHYPALFVTANLAGSAETVTNVRYKDSARNLAIGVVKKAPDVYTLTAYPNPTLNGQVSLNIPQEWKDYLVEVYDMQGKMVLSDRNTSVLHMQSLAEGIYMIRAICGDKIGYTLIKR